MASLAIGVEHKSMSLEVCFDLSLTSHRMRANPHARGVFTVLSLLPDGLSTKNVDNLQEQLPNDVDLRETLSTLTGVALLYVDRDHPGSPYRILPPIREFAKQKLFPPPTPFLSALLRLYVGITGEGSDVHL